MPPRRRPDPEPTLSIFSDQIHIGDRFTEAAIGDEERKWEVISRPVTFKKGHEVRARVQRPGDPETAREQYWPAHARITVRRSTAAVSRPLSRPAPAVADVDDDMEAMRKELRRLRGENRRLENDKIDVHPRFAGPRGGRETGLSPDSRFFWQRLQSGNTNNMIWLLTGPWGAINGDFLGPATLLTGPFAARNSPGGGRRASVRSLIPSFASWASAALMLALVVITGGCVWSVPDPVLVHEPRPQPIPLRIGVYYSPEFRRYTYQHHVTDTVWILGRPSVRLLHEAFALLFTEVVEFERPGSTLNLQGDVAGVIEPTIVSAGYSFPTWAAARDEGKVCFPLHMTYSFTLHSLRGEPVASWEISAQDCAPEGNPLATIGTRKESFEHVMREVAWKFTSGFRSLPEVRRWLDAQSLNVQRPDPSHSVTDRAWQHPWLRVQRLIRSILDVRRDEVTRPVMKETPRDALKEREKIRRAGWMN